MRKILFLFLACYCFVARAGVTITLDVPDKDLETNLRAYLPLSDEPCDAPDWRIKRLFKGLEKDLQPALHALGYYAASIDKALETTADCWQVRLDLKTGPRVVIRERQILIKGEMAEDERLGQLLEELPQPQGAGLHHGEYEAIKTRLNEFAAQYGYFDFKLLRHEMKVYPQQQAAEITLEIDSGPRYRLGEIRFSDQTLNDDFVQRLANLQAGRPYDASMVTTTDRNLSDTGYFDSVEVRVKRDEAADSRIPVDISLIPKDRHAWRAGAGFATDTGPRLVLGYENRYVTGSGHRFDSNLRLSPVESGLVADYMIPGDNPHNETWNFGAGLLREDTDSTLSDSLRLHGTRVKKKERATYRQFLELIHERSTVADEDISSTLLMPGLGYDYSYADQPLRTTRGYKLGAEARVAQETLLSTASFIQFRLSGRGLYRFGELGRLSARAELGTTLIDDVDDLPVSLRYFAGGDNSVRGYDYKSLGPLDADGEVKGGRHLVTASIEYEHPVYREDWWAAVFADTGNAFDKGKLDLRSSFGLGLRWYSPVGRARVDIAFPDDTAEDSWRVHFGLGTDL